jgi:hypothetical protein
MLAFADEALVLSNQTERLFVSVSEVLSETQVMQNLDGL